MADAAKNFTIKQGASLSLPFYWYDGEQIVKPITELVLGYPTVATAVAHGLPVDQIPVQIVTCTGTTSANTAPGKTVYALKLSDDTFSLPTVNTSGGRAYTGGGYVVYRAPKDITGYTARLQLRQTKASGIILLDCTSVAGELVIGDEEGKTTLVLDATATGALTFATALYQLELTSSLGVVTRLAGGTVTLDTEVVR